MVWLHVQEVDVAGLPVRTISRAEPVAGRNARLTIDLQLQSSAEKALVKQLNHINGLAARPGSGRGRIAGTYHQPCRTCGRSQRQIDHRSPIAEQRRESAGEAAQPHQWFGCTSRKWTWQDCRYVPSAVPNLWQVATPD